jgi:hypothetical protein
MVARRDRDLQHGAFPGTVDSASGQDVVGNLKEIWPQVLEKADALLNGG